MPQGVSETLEVELVGNWFGLITFWRKLVAWTCLCRLCWTWMCFYFNFCDGTQKSRIGCKERQWWRGPALQQWQWLLQSSTLNTKSPVKPGSTNWMLCCVFEVSYNLLTILFMSHILSIGATFLEYIMSISPKCPLKTCTSLFLQTVPIVSFPSDPLNQLLAPGCMLRQGLVDD